jgi:glucose-6-phosphate-specific signal transduction histidine kinase
VGVGRYSPEVEAAVYFCCLEALQNVVKYAAASQIAVRLTQKNGTFAFEVSDDGRGFDPNTAQRGSGLQGMADRIEAIGGTLVVETGAEPAPPCAGGSRRGRWGAQDGSPAGLSGPAPLARIGSRTREGLPLR